MAASPDPFPGRVTPPPRRQADVPAQRPTTGQRRAALAARGSARRGTVGALALPSPLAPLQPDGDGAPNRLLRRPRPRAGGGGCRGGSRGARKPQEREEGARPTDAEHLLLLSAGAEVAPCWWKFGHTPVCPNFHQA